MQHVRHRVRELTARSRLLPVDWVTEDVNRFLRGWAAYFQFGNSADQFDKINGYARMRLAWFITCRHRRNRGIRWSVPRPWARLACLFDLTGTVAAPRPFRTGGKGRMPAVNDVGELCGRTACTVRRAGTGNGARNLIMVAGVAQPTGKPAEQRPQGLPSGEATAPAPDPTCVGGVRCVDHVKGAPGWEDVSCYGHVQPVEGAPFR